MNGSDTHKGIETFPIFVVLAYKVGFVAIEEVKLGTVQAEDIVDVANIPHQILARTVNDGNPHRNYLDLQLIILTKVPVLYHIWGEMMQESFVQKKKINLQNLTAMKKGEELDESLKDEWKKVNRPKTIPSLEIKKVSTNQQTGR